MLETSHPTEFVSSGYSFVTVVFEPEFELLCLQARSIALYGSTEVIAAILILDNFALGMSACQRSQLSSSYGVMSSQLRILRRDEFPRVASRDGYITQQLLKLFVSDIVTTLSYVILDAKSHLVRPLDLAFLQAIDGRPRMRVYPYTAHPLRKKLLGSLDLFGLERAPSVAAFTPTVPPFTMVTSIARALIRSDPRRTGEGFTGAFLACGLSEFLCYSAFLLSVHGSFEAVYVCDQPECQILWGGKTSRRLLLEAVARCDRDGTPIFAIHRRALESFSVSASVTAARWWVERGLFDSQVEALGFLVRTAFRSRFERGKTKISKVLSRTISSASHTEHAP